MKIIRVISELNQGKTMPALAKELGVSKDTLRRRLNNSGYKYDNSLKKYNFTGTETEKNKVDNMEFSDKNIENIRGKSDNKQKKEVKKDDKKENCFSEEEYNFLKKICEDRKITDLGMFIDLAYLPSNKETKKSSIVISKELHDSFDEFAVKFEGRRISKNSLIELALSEFMKKYR